MFDNDSFITILFRLANFGLIIAVIAYLFKRYIYDILESKVAAEYNERRVLEEKRSLLESQLNDYHDDVREQRELCKELRVRVHIWRDALDTQRHNEKKEIQLRAVRIAERHEKQATYRADTLFRARVFDAALEDARKELKVHFDDAKKNRDYVGSLLNVLGESKQ